MRNVYFVIQLGIGGVNLKALRDRGWEKRFNVPNRNLHYRLSLDGKQAIAQADLTEAELSWLEARSFAAYLGECIDGEAEDSVHRFLIENAADWSAD